MTDSPTSVPAPEAAAAAPAPAPDAPAPAPVPTTAEPTARAASPSAAAADLPVAGRRALVTLLTHRFVSRRKQREAWAGLLAHEEAIRHRLAEMFLDLEVDHAHEVAFKRQAGGDDVPVLLRREKPLSRDASFLLVFLRREHAFADADDDAVVVSRDQVAEFLGRLHDDSHDEVRAARRVDAAIAALVQRDLLEPEPDDPQLFTVAPAIVPLVRPEQLLHLERVFLEAAGAGGASRPDEDAPLHDSPADDDADGGVSDDGPDDVAAGEAGPPTDEDDDAPRDDAPTLDLPADPTTRGGDPA